MLAYAIVHCQQEKENLNCRFGPNLGCRGFPREISTLKTKNTSLGIESPQAGNTEFEQKKTLTSTERMLELHLTFNISVLVA